MSDLRQKLRRYALGILMAVLVFAFATAGDFSWITLTGAISLEPELSANGEAVYIASPALRAVNARILFLLACLFFCLIPNLGSGLRQNCRFLIAAAVVALALFAWILGSFAVFAATDPADSRFRIAALAVYCVFLLIAYDPARRTFSPPRLLRTGTFPLALIFLALALCGAVSAFFHGLSWIPDPRPEFMALRASVFVTALAGALAIHSWHS